MPELTPNNYIALYICPDCRRYPEITVDRACLFSGDHWIKWECPTCKKVGSGRGLIQSVEAWNRLCIPSDAHPCLRCISWVAGVGCCHVGPPAMPYPDCWIERK